MAGDPRERDAGKRLLVLGAGPAQLGLLAAARARELHVIAARPRSVGTGLSLRRPPRDRLDRGRIRDRAARERGARRRADRPGHRLAGGDRGSHRGAARAAASDLAGDGGAVHLEAAPARAVRGGRRAAARVRDLLRRGRGDGGCRADRLSLRDQGAGPAGTAWAHARRAQPRRCDEAVRVALDASRTATLLVEEHVPGREVTVNAFSSGGHFHPLTVTDRLTAPLPAFGVALTHAWPSELEPAADRRRCRGRIRGGRRGRDRRRARATRRCSSGPDGPSRRRARRAARRRARRRALPRRARSRPERRCAVRRLGRGDSASALAPVARVGGACVRFLVPPPGELQRGHRRRGGIRAGGDPRDPHLPAPGPPVRGVPARRRTAPARSSPSGTAGRKPSSARHAPRR